MAETSPGLSRTVERDLKAVAPVALAVHAYAEKIMGADCAAAVELALVEALTNAIKHGSINGRETGQITVTVQPKDDALVIEVIDTVPVVPEGLLDKAGAQRPDAGLDDVMSLAESGRGLSIIVLSMDEVSLRTANDRYVLSMVKYISD